MCLNRVSQPGQELYPDVTEGILREGGSATQPAIGRQNGEGGFVAAYSDIEIRVPLNSGFQLFLFVL